MMSRSAINPVVESAEALQSGIFTVASADHLPDAVLRASESSVLEFKRVSGKMVGKALETLCAFANTDGGTAGGFEARHAYPMRVVKEAIVNAVIHRDYRLNRDIFVRLFDNRIEVESPGGLPGAITAANIAMSGSRARNPLIARALFDFPVRPNIDAGEGVRMMFAEMREAGLYPPQYQEGCGPTGDAVLVTMLNAPMLPLWDGASAWIDGHGTISNADLWRIGGLSTLKASKILREWVELGLLKALEDRGKRNMAYRRPVGTCGRPGSFSALEDNNGAES